MTEAPDRIESLFAAAVALPTPAERVALLDRECGGDQALRGRVEVLLRAHDRAGHLLDRPVPGGPEQTGPYIPSEQPGTVIAGRYKLLEEIGEGGMGTVWVAEQTQPVRRKVALKLIKAGMDSKSVLARFEAERQALAVMDHPNIAKVLDGGLTETGRPFFVMEYVKGVRITEYCDATRLSIPERLQLFAQVCQAVQHAHQKGIIHRDLKPSNILVAPYDDKPVPKVIDFGLAKAMHQSLTERTLHTAHETVLGTPLYMSPEQAQLNNLDVDTRSDIYSLGVLLYELLTGTTPLEKKRFKEAAWDEIRRLIREEEPPRPSTRLSSSEALPSLAAGRHTEPARLKKLVRGELDWIVMKSLEKDRARRYETANGFAMDIQRYLAGEPVLAVPPSAGYRLRKFVRKHRVGLTTAAAIVLLLMAVVVVQVRANRDLAVKIAELADEQAKVETRNRELAEEQAKVEKRFELALKAIAKLHTGVSEDMLLKSDQFKGLRNQLLKEAADFYGDLEKLLEGQADAKSRRLLAAGYFQLAELTGKIGSMPEAVEVHRKALAVRRELSATTGADVETRLDVARSLGAMGLIFWLTGDAEGALRCFTEGQAVAGALDAEYPTEAVQAVLAQSYYYSGVALQQLGKVEDALVANGKGVAILGKLVEGNPGATELRSDLAASLHSRGYILWDMGKWVEDFAAHDNARVILEKLVKDNPTVIRFQWQLGNTCNDIGSSWFDEGKPADALASIEKARALAQRLVDTYPAATAIQFLLGTNLMLSGHALADLGKPAEAMASQEKALAIFEKLLEGNPTDIVAQCFLAQSENAIGELLAQKGRLGESLRFHENAQERMQKQAEAHPASYPGLVQRWLAISLERIGLLLSGSGRRAEALAACQEALVVREKLNKVQASHIYLRGEMAESHAALGQVQRRAGRPAEAAASFRSAGAIIEQLPTITPRNHYNKACFHALLAGVSAEPGSGMTAEQGGAEAEKATAALRQAIAAGFNAVGRLRSDASLDTLRTREDFQKLLKELEAKVAKMLEATLPPATKRPTVAPLLPPK
ncbi:MAG TPA: serine/threonine-protein kinase [Gemmataceae bacterium]|nr:serine/threonine-protein kinase [Gemmataceae bacterium]